MYWGHHYWGMHTFWWFFWLLLIFGVLAWVWARPSESDDKDAATEELRRRYAAGHIDDREYEHRLSVLGADASLPKEQDRPASSSNANTLG